MSLYMIQEQGDVRPWTPITFPLTADVENEIMEQTAERIKGEVWEDIENAFPEFRLPTSKQPSAQKRLARYTQVTAEPDFVFLRDRQYLKKYRQGLVPILMSPFWQDLMTIPPVFEYVQRDMMRLTNFIEDAEE